MTLPILNMTAFSDVRISTKRGDEGKIMNDESSIYSFTKLATSLLWIIKNLATKRDIYCFLRMTEIAAQV